MIAIAWAALIQQTIETDIEFGMNPPAPPGHEICSACGRLFKWGETCTRGGCPCGGDV